MFVESPFKKLVLLKTAAVPREKFDSTNQKHYPDLGSDASSVWISALVSQLSFGGKLAAASPNIGCFRRTLFEVKGSNLNTGEFLRYCFFND